MEREPLKLSFKIDPVKAMKNGYSYDEVINTAERVCLNRNCIKERRGVFKGHGNQYDLCTVGEALLALIKKEWFRECVSEMYLITPNGRENVVDIYKKKGYKFG